MVSVDHFGYELRRQLREAANTGASELPITSHDLCRSIRAGTAWLNACCEAMEQELQANDIVVQDRNGLWNECSVQVAAPEGLIYDQMMAA